MKQFDQFILVGCINSEIVVAAQNGKLSILDENLESKEEFDAGPDAEASDCQSISGNKKFIATGYMNGTVRFWSKSGEIGPVVR